MFERASRLKLRFDTRQGQLSVEDLWDLPLTSSSGRANLDEIAISLYKRLQGQTETLSFVRAGAVADERGQLAFDIVKHVIDVRQEENKAAADRRAKAEKKQQILGLIARKEEEQLGGMPLRSCASWRKACNP